MNFFEFRNRMYDLACFNIDQVYAWKPGFDRNNLYRWIKKGLLVRLRQGYFAFPEYKSKPDFALGLSGHREERFLVKVESRDQKVNYHPELVNIKGCGFYFPMPVPPDVLYCVQ